MDWDGILVFILASFGAVSLLLAQVSDVLARLPQIIAAWRRVRREWSRHTEDERRNRRPSP
ncbi:hypothetical protein [Streptomyces echinatus]|uniref:Uncharacterized protein n=1 Tax=Streptomyces echinatus TaxID=67293 RepID=A0A7W9PPF5_9ACTN|nr:hypothetical protein [Streptomyces echinatus]MBB5925406.1 hypothetical protein [Streptomyces echinatus]